MRSKSFLFSPHLIRVFQKLIWVIYAPIMTRNNEDFPGLKICSSRFNLFLWSLTQYTEKCRKGGKRFKGYQAVNLHDQNDFRIHSPLWLKF